MTLAKEFTEMKFYTQIKEPVLTTHGNPPLANGGPPVATGRKAPSKTNFPSPVAIGGPPMASCGLPWFVDTGS